MNEERANYAMIRGVEGKQKQEKLIRENAEFSKETKGETNQLNLNIHESKIANLFFQKRVGAEWTGKNPCSKTKNEIDFIINYKIDNIKNVTVRNKVGIGIDLRQWHVGVN